MPKVSVIIPTYNCAEYIAEAIDSVLAQTYKNYEIIVIDDGSTDNTKQILKDYKDKIKYIYQKNHGVSIARNNGIINSTGKYVAFLDSDNKWLPNLLAESLSIFEKYPEVGLVHSRKIRISEDGFWFKKDNHGDEKYLSGNIYKYLLFRKANINLSSVVLRRNCLEKVGMFDDNLSKIGCEDRELFLRIAKKYKIMYINKSLYVGRVRKKSMSANHKNMMKGRYYIVDKFCPPKKGLNTMRKKALSSIHFQRADGYIWKSNFREGIREYFKAMLIFPINLLIYIRLAKIFIKTIIKFIQKFISIKFISKNKR